MKPGLFLFFLSLLVSAPVLLAETAYDKQLTDLQSQRDKALSAATEPIFRRYRTALEELLQKATRANDLDAAVKIKAALDSSQRVAIASEFEGRWAHTGIKSRLQFNRDGGFQEFWNGEVQEGRWDEVTKKVVKVTMNNGAVHEYHLSEDGSSVKRTKEGYVWKRTGISKDE
ncbi:MAG: hypothetical protein EOP88_24480 [Verrucomicrobiaceae bacterium]|nr:MAG: hypothetical protein EOP88_24480 [Verrucomicrobiaceae bacterium]